MARYVIIKQDDLNKLDEIIEYCGSKKAAAKWLKVSSNTLNNWLKAKEFEDVRFAALYKKRVERLHKDLYVKAEKQEPVAAAPRTPVFSNDLRMAYDLVRKMELEATDVGIRASLGIVSNLLAHKILES